MEIIINNQKKDVPEQSTILNLFKLLDIEIRSAGMAVAVNKKVIPKEAWETTLLNDQDDVLLIRASQGG